MDMHPVEPIDKYRTQNFWTEKDRVRAHKAKIKRARSPTTNNKKSHDSLKSYAGDELYVKPYEVPEAYVPYPHKGKAVKPWGFVRDEPNLADKVLKRYRIWHDKRRDACNLSV